VENEQAFVDYYEVLQVNPKCDDKILERAYRYFAKLYHPDHTETANVKKFTEVTEAYTTLRDENKRADYDRLYFSRINGAVGPPPSTEDLAIDESTAIRDAGIHERILLYLYKRRRENAREPGVPGWLIQEITDCSDDNFEFHIWYLKSKGFIHITEQGTLAVTIQGVDHVISTCRTSLSEKLLIGQSNTPTTEV
jgi:curved DNA-binding protein